MKKVLSIISVIIAVPYFESCVSDSRIGDVWSCIQERPDSALVMLDRLPSRLYKGRTKSEYQLLRAIALDKNYINVSSDSLARPAYEFFHQHGPREKEMMSLYYLALSHYYAGEYEKCVSLSDQAIELATICHNDRYAGLSYMLNSSGYRYSFNAIDAIQSAQRGIEYLSLLPDSTFQVRRARQQLADCFISNNELLKACSIYKDLLVMAPADTFLQTRGLPNYAWAMYMADESKASESLATFERAIIDYHLQMTGEQACQYAILLLCNDRRKEAESILYQLEQLSDLTEYAVYLKYRIFKSEGNYKDALDVYESLLNHQNDLAIERMKQSLVRLQRDYKDQILQNTVLKGKRRLYISLLLGLLLCLFIFFYFAKRKKAKLEREELMGRILEFEQQTTSVNESLEEELADIKRRYVATYKKQFRQVASLMEDYYLTSGKKEGRDYVYRQVMELTNTIGNDYEAMRALEKNVNKALDNAMSRYRKEFPDKERSHYQLVCYFMAGFPASTIELLMGIPQNTVYTKKKRLLDNLVKSDTEFKELFLLAIK